MRREEFGLENLVKALNHMKGTLLICDRNRNVVYYNDVVCSALDIPEERLSGANLMGLAEEGYILNSASIQAFETRQLSIKYVRGKMKRPILTVSNPVLDENGEVALVVAVSFNEQIEAEYGQASNKDSLAGLMAKVCQKRDRELMMLEGTARSLTRKAQANAGYMEMKLEGDLLSSYKYLLKPHMDHIEVDDYTTGGKRVIALDPKLTPSENIEACYARYQKAKGTWQDSVQEYEKIKAQKAGLETHYRELLLPCDDERVMIRRLQKELREETADKKPESASPGLTFHSGKFTILVGRNAKENDALLRHWVKSYDWWMHTRDWPGGYVFIKAFKDKSVPLEVMLDAANLAVTYSKGKNQGAADLYYTQVKYLRRAKDGPLGLVLPTQEKNFFVKVDQDRLARVMQTKEGSDD